MKRAWESLMQLWRGRPLEIFLLLLFLFLAGLEYAIDWLGVRDGN